MEILVRLFIALKEHQLEDETRSDYKGLYDAFLSPLRQKKIIRPYVAGQCLATSIPWAVNKASFSKWTPGKFLPLIKSLIANSQCCGCTSNPHTTPQISWSLSRMVQADTLPPPPTLLQKVFPQIHLKFHPGQGKRLQKRICVHE